MRLTADRLDVIEGEPLHAVVIVHPSAVSVLAAGGVEHLRHTLIDVGFRDVSMFIEAPAGWTRGRDVPTPGDLEWLVWVEATPVRSASLTRALTDDLRIADAWDARLDESTAAPSPHPYSVVWFQTARVAGFVRVFGFAYPVLGREASC